MINKDELNYKITAVLNYLKNHNGYKYKLYNHLCPNENTIPDSNIVEYMEDIQEMILELLSIINI